MKYEEIEGIIFPLPKKVIERIVENKTIFIKYTSRIPSKNKNKIFNGKKLYLYQSKSNKTIVGESTITNSEYLLPKIVLKKYKEDIMLTEKEFYKYTKNREKKELLVLSLKNSKKYANPLNIKKRMTMTGIYLNKSNIREIIDLSE